MKKNLKKMFLDIDIIKQTYDEQKTPIQHINNLQSKITKITDLIWLGGCNVNLDNNFSRVLSFGSKLKYPFKGEIFYFDIRDRITENLKDLFEISSYLIDQSVKNNQKIYIHCECGVSRSVTMLMAYMIKYEKKSFDECFELLKNKCPHINPNISFIFELENYQKDFLDN